MSDAVEPSVTARAIEAIKREAALEALEWSKSAGAYSSIFMLKRMIANLQAGGKLTDSERTIMKRLREAPHDSRSGVWGAPLPTPPPSYDERNAAATTESGLGCYRRGREDCTAGCIFPDCRDPL